MLHKYAIFGEASNRVLPDITKIANANIKIIIVNIIKTKSTTIGEGRIINGSLNN